ncbi:hypothetical protein GMLC_21570 [Geomonas limicola]|uniref:Lipoprotein n=1 Tax=Geomonas limicola TaxID=2740186 RepID=A0A6V8N7P6_9BACT|nr:hypothetical protein [Geomonas limicola]GFO68578.1 hypothetical protein GMLC_21570 [Geomonas limicola]
MRLKLLIAGALLALSSSPVIAGHLHPEREYQAAWCQRAGGEQEVVLDDRSRVDCLTEVYAVEVEFAPKWKEAVGQSLFYGLKLKRRPGIVLILEEPEEHRYLDRLKLVADRYGIQVWEMGPGALEQ